MKGLFKKLENMYAAAAFAEEGEHEKAREILRERRSADRPRKNADKDQRVRLRAN